jgi:uncharacterized protein
VRRRLTRAQARRAVLGALGLARPRPAGPVGARHLARLYRDLGVVQIDPINVLARAHHQVAMTRLGPYDVDALDRFVWRSGQVWEGWVHVDATATADTWPLFAHRRATTMPWRGLRALEAAQPGYLDRVLAEVAERGELTAAQLTDPGGRIGSWGTRSLGRAALDHLHHRGLLAISWRDRRMTAHFDLAERVIPARWLRADVPEPAEAERLLLVRAIGHMGVGTAADAADWWRLHVPTARRHLADLARTGEVVEVDVDGWAGPVYARPDLVVPRRVEARALVNPFDPLIWNRPRTLRLFDLDYRIEIYVPAAERRHGYYALPFLLGEELVALVDLKHDRASRRLLVRQLTPLGGAAVPARTGPLADELAEWARWVGAEAVAAPGDGTRAASPARPHPARRAAPAGRVPSGTPRDPPPPERPPGQTRCT